MTPYKNTSGDSGVTAYTYGDDWIRVQFSDGSELEFEGGEGAAKHLAAMKHLAEQGFGLNRYIKHVQGLLEEGV